MIGREERIINNILSTSEGEYKIHIDYATITNLDSGETNTLILERTGVSIDGRFRAFREYVFFIQNNLIQHSGSCVSTYNLVINSNHVRLEKNGVIKHAVILDNVLTELTEEEAAVNINRNDIPLFENTPRRPDVNQTSLSSLSKDSQNVHNSSVVNKFKFVYSKIVELVKRNTPVNQLFDISIDYCKTLLKDKYRNKKSESKEKLNRVLQYIIQQNGYIYNLQNTETQILRNIVLYILNCVNSKNQDDVFVLLCDNLTDCVEYENIVCLTGRVSRILNSVEYLIDIHLSMTEKYPSVEDAKEGMLKIAIKMFNNEKKLEEIYKKIIEEFKHLDKDKLIAEIDSWGLDTLY